MSQNNLVWWIAIAVLIVLLFWTKNQENFCCVTGISERYPLISDHLKKCQNDPQQDITGTCQSGLTGGQAGYAPVCCTSDCGN